MDNTAQQNQDAQTPPAQPVPPTPQRPPAPNAQGKKKLLLKLIIGIVVFLLLAGGAAAGYVYREPLMKLVANPTPTPGPVVTITPTPSEFMNFLLTETNISFSYPSSWKISETGKSGSGNHFIDLVGPNSETQIKWDGEGYGGGCPVEDKKDYEILGKTYELCHSYNEDSEDILIIFETTDGTPIMLSSAIQSGSDDANTIYQILSTFKFTDTQTIDTTGWKTYTNTSLGFEIKFPQDFNANEDLTTFYRGKKLQLSANSPMDPYPAPVIGFLERPGYKSGLDACNAEMCLQNKSVPVLINNIKGVELSFSGESYKYSRDGYISNGSDALRYSLRTTGNQNDTRTKIQIEKDFEELNTALSTFKFTN